MPVGLGPDPGESPGDEPGGDPSRDSGRSLADLDVGETLAAAAAASADRHRAEVYELEVDLHFAELHSAEPDNTRAGAFGGSSLVQLGGAGTPRVQDLPLCELALARQKSEAGLRGEVADALDLAFRLTGYWAGLRAGRGEVWVGRRIARMARHLDRVQVKLVDAEVTAAIDEAPSRVLKIAEAAVLKADPDHAREVDEARRRRRILAIGRVDEDGLRTIFARIAAGDMVWVEALLERIADALDQRPDLAACETREELLAEAFGWLAHPEDVIALLDGTSRAEGMPRPRVVLYAHLSQAAVDARLAGSPDGVVVRVEELGPMLLEDLVALTGRADVELKPVIDLNHGRSVNQYEHPVDVKERGLLRTTGDVFPHAQAQSRSLDRDHPEPYAPNGPPGQTGDHNHAPLGRRHHRAKTHLAYTLWQLDLGRYLWRSPHGLWRLVDGAGTHPLDEQSAQALLA